MHRTLSREAFSVHSWTVREALFRPQLDAPSSIIRPQLHAPSSILGVASPWFILGIDSPPSILEVDSPPFILHDSSCAVGLTLHPPDGLTIVPARGGPTIVPARAGLTVVHSRGRLTGLHSRVVQPPPGLTERLGSSTPGPQGSPQNPPSYGFSTHSAPSLTRTPLARRRIERGLCAKPPADQLITAALDVTFRLAQNTRSDGEMRPMPPIASPVIRASSRTQSLPDRLA